MICSGDMSSTRSGKWEKARKEECVIENCSCNRALVALCVCVCVCELFIRRSRRSGFNAPRKTDRCPVNECNIIISSCSPSLLMDLQQVDNSSLLSTQTDLHRSFQGDTMHGKEKGERVTNNYALLLLLRVHYAWDQHPILIGVDRNVFPLIIDRAHPYNDANYLVNDNHFFLPHRSFPSHGISVARHNILPLLKLFTLSYRGTRMSKFVLTTPCSALLLGAQNSGH